MHQWLKTDKGITKIKKSLRKKYHLQKINFREVKLYDKNDMQIGDYLFKTSNKIYIFFILQYFTVTLTTVNSTH